MEGRYDVLREIERGGMARIVVARKRGQTEHCVLKQLRPELRDDPHKRARFEREAELAKRLVHPNIARVYESGTEAGELYIAMELIAGIDLADLLYRSGGRIPH